MATFGRVALAVGVGAWTVGVEGAITLGVVLWLVGLATGYVIPESAPPRRPIPGIPGAEAELRDGRWIRVR